MWRGPASVIRESDTMRSYQVNSPKGGEVRRNRRHLQLVPSGTVTGNTDVVGESSETKGAETQQQEDSCKRLSESNRLNTKTQEGLTVTRSSRVCKPVTRLDM